MITVFNDSKYQLCFKKIGNFWYAYGLVNDGDNKQILFNPPRFNDLWRDESRRVLRELHIDFTEIHYANTSLTSIKTTFDSEADEAEFLMKVS